MGCDLQAYRARIGGWAARVACVLRRGSVPAPSLDAFALLIIATLLIIGGVEMNPGPVSTRRGAPVDVSWRCVECCNGVGGLRDELARLRQEFLKVTAKLAATQKELQNLRVATRVPEVERAAESATETVTQLATADRRTEVTAPAPAAAPAPTVSTATTATKSYASAVRGLAAMKLRKGTNRKKCVVFGDSIVRHVGHENLQVKCFPGIRVEQLKAQIEASEVEAPETVIIHGGSNNLRGCRSFDHLTGEIYDLGVAAKKRFPSARIVLSGVIRRRDVWSRKVARVNRDMDYVAKALGFIFVDPNGWISESALGRDGVHLNRRGVAALSGLYTRVAEFCARPPVNR